MDQRTLITTYFPTRITYLYIDKQIIKICRKKTIWKEYHATYHGEEDYV